MKKYFVILLLIGSVTSADAADILFQANTKNQFSFIGAPGIGSAASDDRAGMFMLQYSQPATVFRLDGRQNLHVGHVLDGNTPWSFAGASLDVILASYRRVYAGAGIGGFIRTQETERLNSRFTFGERAFIGCRITPTFGAEVFIQHFSNGDLTDKNLGYNFLGLSGSINF